MIKFFVDGWSVNGFQCSYCLYVLICYEDMILILLVVVFYGGVVMVKIFEDQLCFLLLVDVEGFFVVYLNGIGIGLLFCYWNGGYCCVWVMKKQIDDIGFVNVVIEDVVQCFQVDCLCIYVVGYFNGGMFVYNFVVEYLDKVVVVGIFVLVLGFELQGELYWVLCIEKFVVILVLLIYVYGFDDFCLCWCKFYKMCKKFCFEVFKFECLVGYWVEVNGCSGVFEQQQFFDGVVMCWDWCSGGLFWVVLLGFECWGYEWFFQV